MQNSIDHSSNVRIAFAGNLFVSSGKLVARDPYSISVRNAFKVSIPQGTHPVYLSIIPGDTGEQVIGAASLHFREELPAKWELALRPGQRLGMLKDGQIFGYCVESGLACFLDLDAVRFLQSRLEGNEAEFSNQLEQHRYWFPDSACQWGNIVLDPQTKKNLVFFMPGGGDGVYPSYFGYSATGELIGILTDFGLLDSTLLSDQERLSKLYLPFAKLPAHNLYRGIGTQIVVSGWQGDRAYLASDHHPSRQAQQWGYMVHRVPKDLQGTIHVTRFPSFFIPDEQVSAPCHYVAECNAPASIECAHCQRHYCVKCATELLAKGKGAGDVEDSRDHIAHCPECQYPKRGRW